MTEQLRRRDPLKHIPEWAVKERSHDLSWIGENLHVFWPAALQGFQDFGRGAVVIDATTLVGYEDGMSNPFVYLTEKVIEDKRSFVDALRMVRSYDPSWEFIAVLLKPEDRESTYRIGIPDLKPNRDQ
jgi:hypothetical protein